MTAQIALEYIVYSISPVTTECDCDIIPVNFSSSPVFIACLYCSTNVHCHIPQLSGNYRMHLRSATGPINVLVLNQDEGVAAMVPMPKCPRTSAKHTHAGQSQTEGEATTSVDTNDELSLRETTAASRTQTSISGVPGEMSPDGMEGSIGQCLKTQHSEQSEDPLKQISASSEESGKSDVTSELPMEIGTPASDESPNKDCDAPQRSGSLAAIVERLHKGNEEKSQDQDNQEDGKPRNMHCYQTPIHACDVHPNV